MEDFYYDIFGTANIPEVPDELTSSISYDAPSDSYHVIASSGEGLSYIVSDIVISMSDSSANSAKSAVITFDGLDIDNNVHNTVCVEIEYSADSSYLYTVISAYPTNDSE